MMALNGGLLFSGFIKFLEPYYMLLITKRRQIGVICGHTIYAVSKSEMIPLSNSTVQSSITNSKNENRSLLASAYKCLLSMVLVEGTVNVTWLCLYCVKTSFSDIVHPFLISL